MPAADNRPMITSARFICARATSECTVQICKPPFPLTGRINVFTEYVPVTVRFDIIQHSISMSKHSPPKFTTNHAFKSGLSRDPTCLQRWMAGHRHINKPR